MTEAHSFENSARRCSAKYEVTGDAREVFIALGASMDRKLPAFELIVVSRAYNELHKAIEEVYKPRSPLEAQLEYLRARKDYLASTGIDLGDWDDSVDTSGPDSR